MAETKPLSLSLFDQIAGLDVLFTPGTGAEGTWTDGERTFTWTETGGPSLVAVVNALFKQADGTGASADQRPKIGDGKIFVLDVSAAGTTLSITDAQGTTTTVPLDDAMPSLVINTLRGGLGGADGGDGGASVKPFDLLSYEVSGPTEPSASGDATRFVVVFRLETNEGTQVVGEGDGITEPGSFLALTQQVLRAYDPDTFFFDASQGAIAIGEADGPGDTRVDRIAVKHAHSGTDETWEIDAFFAGNPKALTFVSLDVTGLTPTEERAELDAALSALVVRDSIDIIV